MMMVVVVVVVVERWEPLEGNGRVHGVWMWYGEILIIWLDAVIGLLFKVRALGNRPRRRRRGINPGCKSCMTILKS